MTDEGLLDRLPDGVVVLGADGAVRGMNGVAERLTGWSRDEAQGRHWSDVLRLRDTSGALVADDFDPFTTAPSMAKGTPERTYMLHLRDGSERMIVLRTSFSRDASGRIEELVATLRSAGRRHRAERSAYDLIATLAHDLRSPLTSIKGFTATMLRKWDRFNDEQKQTFLETIQFDADRMHRLLTDLLDLSRLESGRLEVKGHAVDIVEIAQRVVERESQEAKGHDITCEFPVPFPEVWADPGKVEQVLMNLVQNAIRHADGPVVVAGDAQDDRVTIRVSDAGPGIDPRHLPYVFTKFYRRSRGDRQAGTGLGLYICKGIIEAHGGTIAIERTGTDGTTFAFTLLREPAA